MKPRYLSQASVYNFVNEWLNYDGPVRNQNFLVRKDISAGRIDFMYTFTAPSHKIVTEYVAARSLKHDMLVINENDNTRHITKQIIGHIQQHYSNRYKFDSKTVLSMHTVWNFISWDGKEPSIDLEVLL